MRKNNPASRPLCCSRVRWGSPSNVCAVPVVKRLVRWFFGVCGSSGAHTHFTTATSARDDPPLCVRFAGSGSVLAVAVLQSCESGWIFVHRKSVLPPSTRRVLPVMNRESSLAKNRTAAAMSSGSPIMPSEVIFFRASRNLAYS